MNRFVSYDVSYSVISSGLSTLRVSSFQQSPPALHLQNTVHGNPVQQQQHFMVLQRLLRSEPLQRIRCIISSGARVTPAGMVTDSKDLDGSCLT